MKFQNVNLAFSSTNNNVNNANMRMLVAYQSDININEAEVSDAKGQIMYINSCWKFVADKLQIHGDKSLKSSSSSFLQILDTQFEINNSGFYDRKSKLGSCMHVIKYPSDTTSIIYAY